MCVSVVSLMLTAQKKKKSRPFKSRLASVAPRITLQKCWSVFVFRLLRAEEVHFVVTLDQDVYEGRQNGGGGEPRLNEPFLLDAAPRQALTML